MILVISAIAVALCFQFVSHILRQRNAIDVQIYVQFSSVYWFHAAVWQNDRTNM